MRVSLYPAIRPDKMGKMETRRSGQETRNKMKGRIYRKIYDGIYS